MRKTGIVERGFAANQWQKLHNREIEAGRKFARYTTYYFFYTELLTYE